MASYDGQALCVDKAQYLPATTQKSNSIVPLHLKDNPIWVVCTIILYGGVFFFFSKTQIKRLPVIIIRCLSIVISPHSLIAPAASKNNRGIHN